MKNKGFFFNYLRSSEPSLKACTFLQYAAFLALILVLPILGHCDSYPVTDYSGGLFDKFSADVIPDNCSPDITNFYIDENIGLVKRRGYQRDNTVYFGSCPVRNIAEYSKITGETYKIIIASSSIYYDSPANVIKNDWNKGFETNTLIWLDKIFFINPGEYLTSWDGSTATVYSNLYTPKGRYGIVYANRLFIAGASGERSTVYYSDLNQPNSFPALNFDYVGNDDNDFITGFAIFNSNLYIFKSRSIWVIIGTDIDEFALRCVTKEAGCIDEYSIQEFYGNLCFLSYRGIEKFNGTYTTKISEKIDNYMAKVRQVKGVKQYSVLNTGNSFSKGTFSLGIDTFTCADAITLKSYLGKVYSTPEGSYLFGRTSVKIDTSSNPHICSVRMGGSNQIDYSSFTFLNNAWTFTTMTIVPEAEGEFPIDSDMDLDSLNNPHIAYYLAGTNTYDLRYASYTSGRGWTEIKIGRAALPTGANFDEYYKAIDISVGSNGVAHIVMNIQGGIYYSSYTTGVGFSTYAVYNMDYSTPALTDYNDIKIDSLNNPQIAFNDKDYKVHYASYTPGVGWSSCTVYAAKGFYLTMDIDSQNRPHLSFTDSTGGLYYSSFTPSVGWSNTIIKNSADNPCISIDSRSNPYIFYYATGGMQYSSYTITSTSKTWSQNIVDTGQSWSGGTPYTNPTTGIDLDDSGRPHLTYNNSNTNNNDIWYYSSKYRGLYISTNITTTANWTAWNVIEVVGSTPAAISYYARTSETINNLQSAAWKAIKNGDVISGTTPYLQYKVIMEATNPDDAPTVYSLSANWYDGYIFYPCASAVYKDRYWLSISTPGTVTTNNSILIMDRNNNFTKFQGINAACLSLFRNDLYSGSALNNGWVHKQDIDNLYTDDGVNISCEYNTKDFSFNNPINEKLYQTVWLVGENTGGNISLAYALDGSTVTYSGTINTSLTQTDRIINEKIPFAHATKGRYIRFRLNNTGNQNCIFRGFVVLYNLKLLR